MLKEKERSVLMLLNLNLIMDYCTDHCEAYYEEYCIECGMLVHILNKHALNNTEKGAQDDIPNDILEIRDCFGQTGIYALRIIPAGVKFGPFIGFDTIECLWKLEGEKFVLNKSKLKYLNWMQYVNPTRSTCDRNLHVFQSEDDIYYQSTRQIQAGQELLVYFGEKYENSPNKIIRVNFATTTKDIVTNTFACTFCCLGFRLRSDLAKHKTVCIKDTAGKFSIEELKQCPFCKIHLGLKEYFEHHMAFCCERNARKCISPTPPSEQATAALNRRKRYLRQTYKCENCKYRTNYQADFKEHTNNQHYGVNIYKCGICNRRIKTKESPRLHVKNTHAFFGGNDDQNDSATDYRNTHIDVEQLRSPDQKKIFKCSRCVCRTKYKSLRIHIKTKHLKKVDYKCDSCEFGTNRKSRLGVHIKTKYLKEFDYKCDLCEFGTSSKTNLEVHIKSIHLGKYDYKCDKCQYKTNTKLNYERHIKIKHLKLFDYKCDVCKFGTTSTSNLEVHIKTKHLGEFDYKCDKCEFVTNNKPSFEKHVKSKHLKKFDYKCDLCEFGTNNKSNLEVHIKTKHLGQFDCKCDKCEYQTNSKRNYERHIKIKHLKKFDYKCDLCEFGTTSTSNLEVHIKTKHLGEFDYKCDRCEYKANDKHNLERHIKTNHLKQFDYKCDECDFVTNNKASFKKHVKTKHLK